MKIDVNVPNTITINALVGGDTFYFEPSDMMWMKTIKEYTTEIGGVVNAISLDDGSLAYFSEDDSIIPIKTKVVNDNEN